LSSVQYPFLEDPRLQHGRPPKSKADLRMVPDGAFDGLMRNNPNKAVRQCAHRIIPLRQEITVRVEKVAWIMKGEDLAAAVLHDSVATCDARQDHRQDLLCVTRPHYVSTATYAARSTEKRQEGLPVLVALQSQPSQPKNQALGNIRRKRFSPTGHGNHPLAPHASPFKALARTESLSRPTTTRPPTQPYSRPIGAYVVVAIWGRRSEDPPRAGQGHAARSYGTAGPTPRADYPPTSRRGRKRPWAASRSECTGQARATGYECRSSPGRAAHRDRHRF